MQDQQNAAGAMYALEAFTVLGGRDFVVGYGEQISHGLTTMVTWMRDSKDFRSMAQLLDVLASCVPQEAPTLAAGCVMALIQAPNLNPQYTYITICGKDMQVLQNTLS